MFIKQKNTKRIRRLVAKYLEGKETSFPTLPEQNIYLQLNKSELVTLVELIIHADGTEKEIDQMVYILKRNVPHPAVTDLIFWNKVPLTAEQVVEIALAYKPILL